MVSPTAATRADRRTRALLPFQSFVALLAALATLAVVALLLVDSMNARRQASRWVDHTHEVDKKVMEVTSLARDAIMYEREFLITADPDQLAAMENAQRAIPVYLAALRKATIDNSRQLARLDALDPLLAELMTMLSQAVELAKVRDPAAIAAMVRNDRGKTMMGQVKAVLAEMNAEEQALLRTRSVGFDDAVTRSTYVMLVGATVLLVVIMIFAATASRDFRNRENEGWLRRLQSAVSTALLGDPTAEELGERVLGVLTERLEASVGAMYAVSGSGLKRIAGHALPAAPGPDTVALGEGLLGQSAKSKRLLHVREVPTGYLAVTSGIGHSAPRELLIAPATADGAVQAVTELGFLHGVQPLDLEAVERVTEAIGIAVRSANDRRKLQELLEETQRQGEELQVQQEELRVSNEELEERGRSLQLSQGRLENQQAELEEINTQLEEQSRSLVRQRDELARTGVELQRSSSYKSEFLANMSHELRTPLNSSLILAKLLADNRERNLTPEQIKFAETIYSAGNDLLTLINDILDLSKIESGKVDLRIDELGIERVLEELGRTFGPVAADKQLALTATAESGAPRKLETDSTRLQQILKNLLSNALKFTEQGGVTLTVRPDPLGIAFAVHDTGIGIAPEQHDVVFEAFRQADGTINRRYGGTGLGLSISRDLARLLGGELTLESAVGRGSTFTLHLPLCYVARDGTTAPASVPWSVPLPPRRKPSSATVVRAMQDPVAADRPPLAPGARALLIIEDDPAFAQILVELAAELEFQGVHADTAAEGLALAKQYQPSAIVLDIGLPDRSGLSVLDALKHDPTTRHIPVHVISSADHTQAALEMGAVGYALKPVDRDKLITAIRDLERRSTQRLRQVLVVEDDAVLRASTARLLAGADVKISSAGTSADALELLAKQTFDCMILDLSLPDRSGLELLEEMSRHERYGFPPVIVYTGRALSRDEEQSLRRFSQSIIIKGARSPERLLDEVTLFLHQVEADLPPERQRMLRAARDREIAFEGRRILLVEDDVRNIFALTSVLEPKGAKVEIARNGQEALDHLAAHPGVDLVLMDVMMPVMDGIEATRAIRAQPALAKVPIIALTAKAMIDDRERCLAAGANDYIAKPLDVDKLLSLARVWIRK